MKEAKIFETYFGSKLYGTQNENSDTDIFGVFLPSFEDLVICNASKVYSSTTSSNNKINDKNDVDKKFYSLQNFFIGLRSGDINALELFFAKTNKNATVFTSDLWNKITSDKNIDKLIYIDIKKINGFINSNLNFSFSNDHMMIKNIEFDKKFFKKIHHALRVSIQIYDLLKNEKIIYPFSDDVLNILMKIKDGTSELSIFEIKELIKEYQEKINVLYNSTRFSKNVDYEYQKNLIVKIYKGEN